MLKPPLSLLVPLLSLTALFLSVPSAAQAQGGSDGGSRTGPVSGYMDFHVNKELGQDARIDFHRFVLLLNHSFTNRIRFVGELELEHAVVEGLEEGGELELEQAYVDFLISRGFNVRAGMMLVPLGIINERHEPPVFHGVERPFVDTVILPSTWFEAGAGIHGEVGRGLRYRAYAMAPLDALRFTADEGIRGGRQKGVDAAARRLAYTARAEYIGVPDLTVGAGFWTGESAFSVPRLNTAVRIGEVDVRYQRGRTELRGQFAQVGITEAAQLNAAIRGQTGIQPNIARTLRGFYGEAAYRVWDAGAPRDLVAFVRYENFDTQYRMPDGIPPLKTLDRDAWVTGVTYYPEPDIAVKVDYVHVRNQSGILRATRSFNVGLGWWF
ncbi:MAG: hypothetical protein ABL982_01260 [Vicinamibacterales bacterium]